MADTAQTTGTTDGPVATTVANNGAPLDKDFSNGNSHADALHRVRTAGSINIPPELFEKLYLTPPNPVKGELRKTFGNPTPLALVGFLLCLTPLSIDLMGWRGAGGVGAASTGVFIVFGAVLMILAAIGEWIVGNTFPFVVFGTYGAFWGALAFSLIPWFNAYGAYVTDPAEQALSQGNPGNSLGLASPAFNASFAFFLLFMAFISLIFLICSVRTNIAFVLIFLTLFFGFICLTAAYFYLALVYENPTNTSAEKKAGRLVIAGGSFFFVTSLSGWWILFAIMLASLDFPFSVPVGDLSHIIKGASEKQKIKDSV